MRKAWGVLVLGLLVNGASGGGASDGSAKGGSASGGSAKGRSANVARVRQTSHPAVDSANAARTAARAAARTEQAGERVALLERATHAWPTQPAYWQMLARASALAGDSLVQQRANAMLTALDVGAGTVPQRAIPVHTLDSLDFVESIARDDAGTAYVTEMRRGTVYRIDGHGGARDLRLDTLPGMSAVWAVRATRQNSHLLVASAPMAVWRAARAGHAATSSVAWLWTLDARTGAVVDRVQLPDTAQEHAPGDLLVLRSGWVVISDAASAALYVRENRAAPLRTIRHPLLRSPQGVVEVAPNVLVVADYSHGLLRVRLPSGAVERVQDAPRSTVLGLDGLAWHRGQLLAVQNGLTVPRVVAIRLDAAWSRVEQVRTLWRDTTVLTSPTTLAADDEGVWLFTNTQWDNYDEAGQRRVGRELHATRLVRMPWGHAEALR